MDRPRKVELVAERYKFGTALEIGVVLLGLSPFMAVQPWIAALIALLSLLMYREHIGRLARRAKCDGDTPVWEVFAQGALVGTLCDAEFAAAELSAARNGRLMAKSVLAAVSTALLRLVVAIPAAAFWIVVVYVLTRSPAFLEQDLHMVLAGTARSELLNVLWLWLELGLIGQLVIGMRRGRGMGTRNVIGEAVFDQIKSRLGVPLSSELLLVRQLAEATPAEPLEAWFWHRQA